MYHERYPCRAQGWVLIGERARGERPGSSDRPLGRWPDAEGTTYKVSRTFTREMTSSRTEYGRDCLAYSEFIRLPFMCRMHSTVLYMPNAFHDCLICALCIREEGSRTSSACRAAAIALPDAGRTYAGACPTLACGDPNTVRKGLSGQNPKSVREKKGRVTRATIASFLTQWRQFPTGNRIHDAYSCDWIWFGARLSFCDC